MTLFSSHQITINLITHTNNGRRTVSINLIKSLTGSSRTFSKFIIQATRAEEQWIQLPSYKTRWAVQTMLRHLQLELSVASKKKNEIVSIQSALKSKLISLCLSSGYASHVIFLLKRAFLHSQCLFPLEMINSWVLF